MDKATKRLASGKYLLRYNYDAGESVRHELEQLSTIETTISGTHQKTQLRTQSEREFKIESVTAEGNFVFEHRILKMRMWNQVTGRAEVHYDSETDEQPPEQFAGVAEHIGTPISKITMSPLGIIVDRDDKVPHPDVGLGGLSIPLPEQAVEIGHTWSQPLDLRVAQEDGRVKVIKTRELYQLMKVETGVATISVKTQILTPINDAKVKAQIIQRISQGELKFDVDAGRLLNKQLDFDEVVLGFNGAQSKMNYLARFTEKLAKPQVARKKTAQ